MSLRLCSIKHASKMAPVDREELASAANDYVERGMERQAAEEQAIIDKLDELKAVKARIEAEALAEFERKMPERYQKALQEEKAANDSQDNQAPIKNESPEPARVSEDSVEINQEPVKESEPTQEAKAASSSEDQSDLYNQNGVPVKAEKYVKPDSDVKYQSELQSRLRNGDVSIAEFKEAFASLISDRERITAELSSRTKDKLIDLISGYSAVRAKTEKKDYAIRAAYESLITQYYYAASNSSMFSYSGGGKDYIQGKIDAVKPFVDNATQGNLDAYAKEYADAIKEREENKKRKTEGMQDPKTLEDFRNLHRSILNENENMTQADARMQMTADQRAEYDRLSALDTRAKRLGEKQERKTNVSSGDQLVGGTIIETKHTKKGHDLFVVQLEARVSKDDYTTLAASAKRLGGYYSSFRGAGAIPGFQFTTSDDAKAFLDLAGGNTEAASQIAKEKLDAFEDDKSQSTAERLRTMAAAMNERAEIELTRDRKSNTNRRAGMAARALDSAEREKAMAETMVRLADGIESGELTFLDKLRTKAQLSQIQAAMYVAKGDEIRKKYDSYAEQLKHEGEPITAETVDHASWPFYVAYRSDLAKLARQMIETDGLKKLGNDLLKISDDTSAEYMEFAKENLHKVSVFQNKEGGLAVFKTKKAAALSIEGSGFSGKAIPFEVKRGENLIILSSSEAAARGIWSGTDKKITLAPDFAEKLIEQAAKKNRKKENASVPWQLETAYEKRQRYKSMGIETAAEFRAALREYVGIAKQPSEMDKVKKLELAMVGRKKDGLDFFPTPQSVADEMINTAGIQAGMSVLEPSAGMGHIADRIRAFGVEPDVVEISTVRRELLEAKGYNLVGNDFTEYKNRDTFGYGDTFKAEDGSIGILRGQGGLGSDRVRLVDENGEGVGKKFFSMDELTPVKKNGAGSGYDRIVMNPPFSDRRDMEHVLHAYDLLKPGGRIVAIVGEGVMFGSDKKATEFRDWLDKLGATAEKLEEGTFNDPSLPVTTGVNARMLVIDKPESVDILYSLADGNQKPSKGRSFTKNQAQSAIKNIVKGWKNNYLSIEAIDSLDDLPARVAKQVRADGKSLADIKALIVGGKVYINAGRMESVADVESSIFHEIDGHYGVELLFGGDIGKALNRLYLAMGGRGKLKALAKAHGINLDKYEKLAKDRVYTVNQTSQLLVNELLAHIAQDNRPSIKRLVKEVIGAIRSWLRANGFAKLGDMNDTEILHLLKQSREAARNLNESTRNSSVVRYLLSDKSSQNGNLASSFQNGNNQYSLSDKAREHAGPVVSLLRRLAKEAGIFETPRVNSKSLEGAIKDTMRDINANVANWYFEEKLLDVPKENRKAEGIKVYDENYNNVLTVFDSESDRPFIEIGNESIGGGKKLGSLYQGVLGWANNNGKTLRPDTRGLTTINEQRRSEQMISAMLKYDNSGMVEPDASQYAGLLSEKDYKNYREYGKESYADKLEALKSKYWGSDKSPHTSRELTDARINNLALAAAALAKRNAPRAFENAIADSTGAIRERNSEGGVDILDKRTGEESAAISASNLYGVGYSTRQRAHLTLQSIYGGTFPRLVDEQDLRRLGALQSLEQEGFVPRHERAGVEHPRQDGIAQEGKVPLYSLWGGSDHENGDWLGDRGQDSPTESNAEEGERIDTETRSQGGLARRIPYVRDRILRREQTQSLPPSLQDSYERLNDKSLVEKLKTEVKRQLTPAGLLPQPVFDLKIARDGEMKAVDMTTSHSLRGFYDAIEKAYGMEYQFLKAGTRREVNKAMRGDKDVQLAPSVVQAIAVMRDDIKRLSSIHLRQLVADAAALRAEGKEAEADSKERLIKTISDNFDTYLNRSYRAFDDPKWPSKVPAKVYQEAVEFLAGEYANGGAVTPELLAQAKVRVSAILTEGTAFDSMGAFISEGKLGAKDLSIMKKRKDVPAPIRALLGEYEDATVNYAKTVTKMSRLVHNHTFLNNMKQAALSLGLISETQGEGMTKIAADASESYAPLNGLYATHDFKRALVDVMGKYNPNAVYDTIVALNGAVKMGKTVLAPTTAFRNFMSSLFFTFANGHFDYSHAAKSVRVMQVYFKDRGPQAVKDYMLKMRKLGVIYDSPYASEMMDLLKDSQLAEWVERKESWLAKNAGKALDFSQRFYSMGDDFYKIIGFENEKALLMEHRGMSEAEAEKEAAERIRNTYPTYSMIGKGINTLRRFPLVGSFVSFPAEIIRTSYHITRYLKDDIKQYGIGDPIVKRKLAGYAIAAGAIGGLSVLSAALMGVGDDEEKAVRALAPEWSKNSTFLWLGKDEKGNRQYVDLSFLDPYGYWKRPITAVLNNDSLADGAVSGTKDLLSPFLGWDIAAKAIGESAFNGKVSGGNVYNPQDSAGSIALDIGNHLRKALQPGFVTNIERFWYAGMDEKTKTGKPYKASEEVWGLFGWRVATFDPKVALYYQSANYQDNKASASKILSSVASSANDVDDDDLRSAYEKSMAAKAEAFEDMSVIVSAARGSGLSNLQLLGVLRNSGVSVADARALIAGKPPVFAPSKTMMKGAIKKASAMFDDETKNEFKRREKYLNSLRLKGGGHPSDD